MGETKREERRREWNCLTRREMAVLRCFLDGAETSREVAERLLISKRTVDFHLDNIHQKLDRRSIVGVVVEVLRRRLMRVQYK